MSSFYNKNEFIGVYNPTFCTFKSHLKVGRIILNFAYSGYGMWDNNGMARKIRLLLAIIVLTVSFGLLVWGLWPNPEETRIVPVDPGQMQLPTPVSFYMEGLG